MSRVIEEFVHSSPFPPAVSTHIPSLLTTREFEVLQALATNLTNQQIANRLFISENTVKNHIHHILEKLQLNNRREVVNYAREHGLVNI